MFKNNKYTKWYYELIGKRRYESIDGYSETHHIIPKSLGGSNDTDNLVKLTLREHFIAHLLLTKMCISKDHQIKMHWALHRMAFSAQLNSYQYELARIKHVEFLRSNHHSRRIVGWNKKMSDIVKEHWEKDDERRKKIKLRMRSYHDKIKNENPNFYYAEQKRKASLGGKAASKILSKSVEYNGKTYLSWKVFTKETGISKHLYKKYYEKFGIDPSFRIGKDGNMDLEQINAMIIQYCAKVQKKLPSTNEEKSQFANELQQVGLLSSQEKNVYLSSIKEKGGVR